MEIYSHRVNSTQMAAQGLYLENQRLRLSNSPITGWIVG